MDDEELIAQLRHMGIDRDSYRVICLLPLVQVAWADGEIQPGERVVIERVAEDRGLVVGDGGRVLRGWLENPPTTGYVAKGRAILLELARRGQLEGAGGRGTLDEIVSYCSEVARAAGGLFGLLFTVDDQEKAALRGIASTLLGDQPQVNPDHLPVPGDQE